MASKVPPTTNTDKRRVTRSLTAQRAKYAACKATFDTNELVENILAFLPAKNIFGVIRVSKSFKSVIDTSPTLQERMFLRLKSKPGQTLPSQGDLPCQIITCSDAETAGPGYTKKGQLPTTVLNPILQDYLTPAESFTDQGVEWTFDRRMDLVLDFAASDFHTMDSFQQMSLLDTYVTDPPCAYFRANVQVRYRITGDSHAPLPLEQQSIIVLNAAMTLASKPFGPTLRDLLSAASDAPAHSPFMKHKYLNARWRGLHVRKYAFPEWGSMSQLLETNRACDDWYASAIVHRQTLFRINLCGVILQDDSEDSETEDSLPNLRGLGVAGWEAVNESSMQDK